MVSITVQSNFSYALSFRFFLLWQPLLRMVQDLSYLESCNDRLIILPNTHITGFDYVVEVQDQTIQLTYPPERLVFDEK